MESFHIGYGMMFLLFVIWVVLSILIWKFGSGKGLKWSAVVFLALFILSAYFNVHIYRSYRQSSVYGMMDIVGVLDDAVSLIKRGNGKMASDDVAAAAGGMHALSHKAKAVAGLENSNRLNHLAETLMGVAPAVAANNQEAISFVKKADQILHHAKKYPQYPLFLLAPQLKEIMDSVPAEFKIY